MTIYVHPHAVDRWIERVDPRLDRAAAKQRILASEKAIEAAARFGCHIVKLAGGIRLAIDGSHGIPTVVTVFGRDMLPRDCQASR